MIRESDASYLAGLFDGEGCFSIKQRMKKRGAKLKAYPTWDIRIEINMTDQSVIRWVHEVCLRRYFLLHCNASTHPLTL